MHWDELEAVLCCVIDIQLLELVLSQLEIGPAVVREDSWVV